MNLKYFPTTQRIINMAANSVRLLEDITRTVDKKPITYAKKYEVVMVISEHQDVLIVEGKERFSVRKEKTEPCQ